MASSLFYCWEAFANVNCQIEHTAAWSTHVQRKNEPSQHESSISRSVKKRREENEVKRERETKRERGRDWYGTKGEILVFHASDLSALKRVSRSAFNLQQVHSSFSQFAYWASDECSTLKGMTLTTLQASLFQPLHLVIAKSKMPKMASKINATNAKIYWLRKCLCLKTHYYHECCSKLVYQQAELKLCLLQWFLSPFRPPLRPHSPPRPSIWTRGGARQLLRAHCSFAYSFFGNALEWLLKGTWAASTLHTERGREREGKRVRRNCSPRRCFTQDVLFG